MANTVLTSAFISLNDIINNFLIAYTGPGKMVPDAKRTEVIFHARRCLQEFAYDTLKAQFNETFALTAAKNPFVQPKSNVSIINIKRAGITSPTDVPSILMEEFPKLSDVGNNANRYFVQYFPSTVAGEPAVNTVTFSSLLTDVDCNISYTYLSNALTTDEDAAIPKLAEEALYACMIYSIMANRDNPDPNMLQRLLISKIALLDLSKSRLVFTNFT
jgi:hypothetical protein